MPKLRVLSYNVRSLRDDRAAVARVIARCRPDVVCIQEAPRFLRWRAKCAALARTSGLVVVTGGRTAAGNLILSSLAVDVVSSAEVLFSKDPGLHQRGTAIAVLRLDGVPFAVAGTHLDVQEQARVRHVRELDAAISTHVPAEVATIVAADVNDHPGSATWTALTAGRTDTFTVAEGPVLTSTAAEPHQTIDGIFVDPRLQLLSSEVVREPDTRAASDHLPVLAELVLPG